MALQSEVPPLGEANNTFDGQKKSDEDETEAEDLEEGEIQDSGADTEEDTAETKVTNPADAVKNGPKQSPNKSAKATESEESPSITDGTMEATANAKDNKSGSNFRSPSERYFNRFKSGEYVDHDRISESEDNMDINWCNRVRSKKCRSKNRVLDYRKELGDGVDSDDSKGEKKKKRKSKSRPKKLSESRRKKIIERNRKLRREGIIRRIAKPCKYFEEGSCHKGSDCPYQHIPKVPKKKELCRYFLSNNCRKMKTCPYMHGEFPCKFYHTGATCFSGDNCRFSHSPLTEEKKKLLHDYLRIHHADDYHHDKPSRKRESTPIPEPPQKRPCLLGSPPRHIKEAVETKRWQEEMIHLQREQQIDAFEIHLNDNQMALPSPHRRSNFYKDLLSSPVKERPGPRNDDLGPDMNQIPPNVNQMSPNINRMSPTVDNLNKMTARFGRIPENHSKDTVDWKNIQSLIEDLAEPDNNVESAHDYHESSVAKREPYTANNFYSTPSDTNGNSVIKNEPTYEDNDTFDDEYEDYKPLKINQDFGSGEESFSPKRSMDGSSPPHTSQPVAECPDPDPIIIPHHLPRKQRELMLRIQKHQKLKSTTDSDDVQIMEDKPESGAESEREVPEIIEAEDSDKKKTWDSSDDDDEDDIPLTIVLQKLNQTPPPKPKEVPPPQTEKLGPDLSQMLSGIMQKANENRLGSVYQEQNKFWTNILSGTVLPPAKTEPVPTATQLNLRNSVVEETNTTRRVLLPNPVPPPPPPLPVVVEKPKPDIRDPRLKNRDPRMAAAAATSVPNNAMKPEIPNVMPPLSILPLDVSSGRQVNPHHKDVNSLIPNQMPAAIVEGLKGNVPYRLREVEAEPLNYSSYVQASHSDPRLLNDPRLRKLLAPVHTTPNQTSTEKFINSVPKPSSVLPDLPLFASIMVETNPAPNNNCTPLDMPSLPELHLPQLQPQQLQTVSDPRTRRIEPRRISESNIIPPHPPIYEPHTLLPPAPTFAKSSAVPTPEPHILLRVAPTFSKSSTVPTPASHLPRAIVDPRMARLQDPRRMRTLSDPSNKSLVRHPPELKKPTPSITEQTAEPPQLPAMAESKEESKEAKTSPKTEEKSKKNKAVHRNRKTSMDYASPLNSCDDSRLSDTLNYNSYAKRPKKPPLNPPLIDLCGNDSPSVSVGSPLVPDFVTSDSSNLDGDCMDSNMISIKDVFKTRDPTASPFC